MAHATFTTLPDLAAPRGATEQTSPRPSLWSRIMASLVESRMRSAEREINRHRFLLRETELLLGDVREAKADKPFER